VKQFHRIRLLNQYEAAVEFSANTCQHIMGAGGKGNWVWLAAVVVTSRAPKLSSTKAAKPSATEIYLQRWEVLDTNYS
jgi:hypothetical protein